MLSTLLTRARRRCVTDLVLNQFALAVTIAMGGAILLLLAGTQILDWYWVALLGAASLGTGLYRLRKSLPSTYILAQRIDRRLGLADALSTATYFSSNDARGEAAVREKQRLEAEEVARTVDARRAVPFTRSRFAYPAAGLALVACGLFAVRYAVTGTLSLEPSLVKMAFDTFFGAAPQQAKANHKRPFDDVKLPLDPGSPDAPTTQNDLAPDSVLDTVDTPDVNNAMAQDASKSAAQQGNQPNSPDDAQGESGEKGEKSVAGNDPNQDSGDQGDKSKDGKQQNAKQDSKPNSSNENSSLLDKMRDTIANMMNKMKTQPKEGQQSSKNSQNGQQSGQEKGSQKSSQAQKGKQGQNAQADSESEQQQAENGDQKQSAEAKSGEKSSDKSSSQDAKSGIGSSDGDKAAREAEQLAAMGKISEILGKRAQNVTGEVMVEVGSSKQQLKTPWAQRQATHSEAGSEIHRDEVPLMYQQFVQQYFEEIRKTPADPKTTPKPSPKPQEPS